MQHNGRFNYLSGPDLIAADAAARRFLTASPRTSIDPRPASSKVAQIDAFLSRVPTRETGTGAGNSRELRAAFMRAYMRLAAQDRHSEG
jgi:hypothetical protein